MIIPKIFSNTSNKKILLVGVAGLYNYGCEAIVRGTVAILKSVDPLIKVYYASYNYDDDIKRLSNCDIEIIRRPKKKRWYYKNVIRKVCSYLKYTYEVPYDSINWVTKFDVIFSIGGDIYTLNHDTTYGKSLPVFCEKCTSLGLKYVLWGASIGKFEKNPNALKYYKEHLKKIDLIVAREENTFRYLKELDKTINVVLAPDPAFFVAPEIRNEEIKLTSKKLIGINLSPLSALYEYGSISIGVKKQAYAITRLIDLFNCEVLLLPHVLSPSKFDNDLRYLTMIYNAVSENYRSKINLISSDPQFIGIKKYLLQCDFVIAARMHCAINAISVDIPTVFLAYSEKAIGMSKYVYGTIESVISLSDFEKTEKVVELLINWKHKVDIANIRKFNFKDLIK
ncbi:MAG: polysaccharide pyruvyl transferase family protein [Bacteroides sp.]|nr:polysaccharide pyruvyl transferase family protein [Bacteroides sp.]